MAKKKKSQSPTASEATAEPQPALEAGSGGAVIAEGQVTTTTTPPTNEVIPQVKHKEPMISPYAGSPVTIDIGPDSATFTMAKHFLRTTIWSNIGDGKNVFLPGVSSDTGHTLIHYLYTGSYEAFGTKSEFDQALLAFVLASTYKLDGLLLLAIEQIRIHGENMTLCEVLSKLKKDFSKFLESSLLHTYLKERARKQFIDDYTVFTSVAFADSLGKGSLCRYMMRNVLDMFSDKLTIWEKQTEGQTQNDCEPKEEIVKGSPHCSCCLIGKDLSDASPVGTEMVFDFPDAAEGAEAGVDDVISLEDSSTHDSSEEILRDEDAPLAEERKDAIVEQVIDSEPVETPSTTIAPEAEPGIEGPVNSSKRLSIKKRNKLMKLIARSKAEIEKAERELSGVILPTRPEVENPSIPTSTEEGIKKVQAEVRRVQGARPLVAPPPMWPPVAVPSSGTSSQDAQEDHEAIIVHKRYKKDPPLPLSGAQLEPTSTPDPASIAGDSPEPPKVEFWTLKSLGGIPIKVPKNIRDEELPQAPSLELKQEPAPPLEPVTGPVPNPEPEAPLEVDPFQGLSKAQKKRLEKQMREQKKRAEEEDERLRKENEEQEDERLRKEKEEIEEAVAAEAAMRLEDERKQEEIAQLEKLADEAALREMREAEEAEAEAARLADEEEQAAAAAAAAERLQQQLEQQRALESLQATTKPTSWFFGHTIARPSFSSLAAEPEVKRPMSKKDKKKAKKAKRSAAEEVPVPAVAEPAPEPEPIPEDPVPQEDIVECAVADEATADEPPPCDLSEEPVVYDEIVEYAPVAEEAQPYDQFEVPAVDYPSEEPPPPEPEPELEPELEPEPAIEEEPAIPAPVEPETEEDYCFLRDHHMATGSWKYCDKCSDVLTKMATKWLLEKGM